MTTKKKEQAAGLKDTSIMPRNKLPYTSLFPLVSRDSF